MGVIRNFRRGILVSSQGMHRSFKEVCLASREEVNITQRRKRSSADGPMEADRADIALMSADYCGDYDYGYCS